MKNIAIWGFGVYGRKMVRSVDIFWKDEIRIVKIYDLKAPEMTGEDDRISSVENVREDYRSGLFEALMITVANKDHVNVIQEQLRKWGIPLFYLGRQEDFYPADAFSCDKSPAISIDQEGYAYHEFRDMRGAMHFIPSCGAMFLFDSAGRLLKDQWDHYWNAASDVFRFEYPVRFNDPHILVTELPGEYCVLLKLYSTNYWHFTFESLDCVQLLEEAGFTGKYVINDFRFDRQLLNLYGIGDERILSARELTPGTVYSFEKLCFPKLLNNDRACSAKVLKRLSEHMKEKLVRDPERYPSRLYVERTGARKLLNGRYFADKYGLTVIDPGKLSVLEQMNYFYNADIILSAHGANSTNCLYMREGSILIETFGKRWVFYCNLEALRETGVYHLSVVEGPTCIGRGGFRPGDPFCDYNAPTLNLENALEVGILLTEKKAK